MALKDSYGGPTDKRHYPYFINVSFNGQNKEVIFRQNPDYEGPSAEFSRVEKALFQLSGKLQKQ